MNNKRLVASVVEIVIGLILLILNFMGSIDEYWSGMGTALLVVGGLQLARQIKYRTNSDYKEKIDIEVNDERNKYISMRAWSWAGYLFVMIAAVSTIVLKVLEMESLMMMASGSVCLIMILYWISYMHLRKKY